MRLTLGVLIGGGLGVYLGYLILQDLAILTLIIGAVIGAIIANQGRKVSYDYNNDGGWYNGQESDGSDD